MARDFAQIEKAAALSRDAVTQASVLSLPPGYIQGFTVTLRKDYTVLVGGGSANVAGGLVRLGSHQLTLQDWTVSRMDTPQHYYIYLGKDGSFRVDIVPPKFNDTYGYYEQPDFGWRAIGKLFVHNQRIVFAIPQVTKSGREVTIGASDWTGEADYYCDGVADEILIGAAVEYLSAAYGGGRVILLPGVFNLGSDISLTSSNISLEGTGSGTFITGSAGYFNIIGTSSDPVTDFRMANLKTSLNVCPQDVVRVSVEGVYFYGAGLMLTDCDDIKISRNVIDGRSLIAFGIQVGSGSRTPVGTFQCSFNSIYGLLGQGPFGSQAVGIAVADTPPQAMIAFNDIRDVTGTAALVRSNGIHIGADYAMIANNSIRTVKNNVTANVVAGIEIAIGSTSCQVVDNFCYNNGADTGIANTNGNHFRDDGTNTLVA